MNHFALLSVEILNQGGKPMYRNYEEYLINFEEMVANAPKNIKLRKLDREEFEYENYRDKVEWYLMEEWNAPYFHDIFYTNCDLESEELTPEEKRSDKMHYKVLDIIEYHYDNNMSVNQAAAKVYRYLKKKKAI